MDDWLAAIAAVRRTGEERLHVSGEPIGPSVLDFWRWAYSDLLVNTARARLAEFIVASALGVADGVAGEWESFDLATMGGLRVEVKASAYLQSWAQKRPSIPIFGIARRLGWNGQTGEYDTDARRHADVYVFCLLKHMKPETLDPLDMHQWTFFVLPTAKLEALGAQKSVGLGTLHALGAREVGFEELREAIETGDS